MQWPKPADVVICEVGSIQAAWERRKTGAKSCENAITGYFRVRRGGIFMHCHGSVGKSAAVNVDG